jgi:hypothetical protein
MLSRRGWQRGSVPNAPRLRILSCVSSNCQELRARLEIDVKLAGNAREFLLWNSAPPGQAKQNIRPNQVTRGGGSKNPDLGAGTAGGLRLQKAEMTTGAGKL